jgi:hypothetical protein
MPVPRHMLQSWTTLLMVVAAACSVPAWVPLAWADPQAAAPEPSPSFGDAPATADDPAAPEKIEAAYSGGCLSCTGSPRLVPICRRVPIKKKTPHVEYEMKCELVCVPGCDCRRHGRGPVGCIDSDENGCGDAHVRQKKLLVKKVTEKETESYEYRVEWVCADCAAGQGRCGSGSVSRLSRFFLDVLQ